MGSSHDKQKRKKRHKRDSYNSDDSIERREKKLRKQRKKSEKILASFGYSDDKNPFGDSNLSQPFIWTKKYEKEGQFNPKKESKETLEKRIRSKASLHIDEIRKARERRNIRDAEREEFERLKSEELRLRDTEEYQDWQKKEEEFHLLQAKSRSIQRILQLREKPIDTLAKNVLLYAQLNERNQYIKEYGAKDLEHFYQRQELVLIEPGQYVTIQNISPYTFLKTLSLEKLIDLRQDITTYQEYMEKTTSERKEFAYKYEEEYWNVLDIIIKDLIQRLTIEQRSEKSAIHEQVRCQVKDMLHEKTREELKALKQDVEKTLNINPTKQQTNQVVDVAFYEEVLAQITRTEALLRLDEIHQELVNGELKELKMKQTIHRKKEEKEDRLAHSEYDNSIEAREWERHEASKDIDDSEERMSGAQEVTLTKQSQSIHTWSEKYQPRKPRYFNRVKTGYDWNKYNQTHYDHDNPPPKVVQGYKFNLFYPDLIDKHTSPTFKIEKADQPEFCIIRFCAGPPYLDIAFKIVNREWDRSRKKGFKSVFERGILHLYFNFKRHRYRR